MLDIKLIREQPEWVKQQIARRGESTESVDIVLSSDERRRSLLSEVEALKAERNKVSKEIGSMSQSSERDQRIAEMRTLGDRISALDKDVTIVEEQQKSALLSIPNIQRAEAPEGDESANVVLVQDSIAESSETEPRPHWEIGEAKGIIDFERGVKLAGSRFYVLVGAGAKLQRALIQWLLDFHASQGYLEVNVPFVVKEQALWGAGQLPKFRDNLYHDEESGLWWVPTAEVPLTNLYADEILDLGQLPLRLCAYTPCWRREQMSAGRDVRGIKRGHQFDKVEMYTYATPETSYDELEKMRQDAEDTCRALGLATRTKLLATGDASFASSKTYDIEVWSPGVQEWLEVSSVSNTESFQARRVNARYRPEPGAKPEFLHTLNGSGLGVPRTMIAIMENYQQPDGSIVVPEVLRPYVGKDVL